MVRNVFGRAGWWSAIAMATLGALLCAGGAAALSICGTGWTSQTFGSTGSSQTYTVPEGVASVVIHAYGAQGGTGGGTSGGSGGLGGHATGTLAVTPEETLDVYVGGQGNIFNGGG